MYILEPSLIQTLWDQKLHLHDKMFIYEKEVTANGELVRSYLKYLKKHNELFQQKNSEWIRVKICFELVKMII